VIVRLPMLYPDRTFPAVLIEQPNPYLPAFPQVVLEVRISEYAPFQIEAPGGSACEVIEATPQEWMELELAGYTLYRAAPATKTS
jgi:hypothetical protein